MAIKNKFIHFKTRAAFDNYLVDHADDLYNYTTFIKETSEIYTHGNFYKSSNTWDISKLTSDTSYAEVAFKTGKLGDAIALSDDVFSILMSINNNSWSLQFEETIQELLYNPESKLFDKGTTKILAKASSIPLGANSLPLSNGSAAIGKSDRYAKEDHIHPSDQSKQDKLVSGESIKTINNQSLLGEGNIITPDSKVTSAANHYTPEGGTITAGTIINSITKDEKGHIIGIKTANGLDASKITSGTINIERLPKGALERLVIVANQPARFALTTADVQEGDTVKQSDTGVMYFVINSTKLDNEAGYSVYTAGAATSVPWSGVTNAPTKVSQFTNDAGYLTSVPAQTWKSITGKPSVYPPSQHNHPSSNINTLTGYSKPTTTSAIVTSDSLNAALGKLEFALDNKVNTSQLDNYLPLSGGTVTGTLKLRSSFDSKLILDNTDGDNKYQFIEFMQQGTSYGKLGTMGDDLKWNNNNLATQPWIKSNNITYNNEWNIVHKGCKTNGGIFINCRASDISSAINTPVTKFVFLSGTGKTDTANNASVQAKSFITAGGTASQMVLGDGTLAPIPTTYTLPTATSSVLGGIKVGSNITLSSGTISLSKANVTSALGYTPANTSDIPEIPTALPNPCRLKINDISYTGSSEVSITVLKPLKITTTFIGTELLTVIKAGYSYSSTSARTVVSLDSFSESNPDAVIISTKKISFTASNAIKMDGLGNLTGTYYIYRLSYMANGKVAVNGAVYA